MKISGDRDTINDGYPVTPAAGLHILNRRFCKSFIQVQKSPGKIFYSKCASI